MEGLHDTEYTFFFQLRIYAEVQETNTWFETAPPSIFRMSPGLFSTQGDSSYLGSFQLIT